MLKRFILVVAVLVAVGIVLLEPTHVVIGCLRGEAFFRNRPSSYWREKVLDNNFNVQRLLFEPSAVPVLGEFLDDDLDEIRFFACNALAMIGPDAKSVTPQLLRLLASSDAHHRRNAALALSASIPKGYVGDITPLLVALEENDPLLQYYCSIAVGRLGPTATRAVPHLEELVRGDNRDLDLLGRRSSKSEDTIGYAAKWAIKRINQ